MAASSEDAPRQPTVSKDDGSNSDDAPEPSTAALADPTAGSSKKKKKKKKLSKSQHEEGSSSSSGASKMTPQMVDSLLEMNPSLKEELGGMDKAKALEAVRKMDVSELLTGMSMNAKNPKDMASYKFWQTQPVTRFDEKPKASDSGPISIIKPEEVKKEPYPLPTGYDWVTLDLDDKAEIKELYELLTNHYVEDDNAMFRFKYSAAFLTWALRSPGWKQVWHVGVRTTESRKLVASICGVPTRARVRNDVLPLCEINFLCIHKKLRSQRLAPMLIREVTRRCYVEGIYQAIYTAGVMLPTPVATCRYYHRSLDWLKLYEIGFSPMPPGSTKSRMVSRNQLPANTSTPNLRRMVEKDHEAVLDLLNRFLGRYQVAQEFTLEEVDHWLANRGSSSDQIVHSFVVETEGKITDFISFYTLESSVIKQAKYDNVRAAYMYYYALEAAFKKGEAAQKAYRERLTTLVQDALIEAKKAKFDVFNALTMHDNPIFLEQLKFGAGDGMLHWYLYNYRTPAVTGGLSDKNTPDDKKMGGIGMVLL